MYPSSEHALLWIVMDLKPIPGILGILGRVRSSPHTGMFFAEEQKTWRKPQAQEEHLEHHRECNPC